MAVSMVCFNPDCKVSISGTWKKGWRLSNFDFANLCHRCGSIYEEGTFCEIFHKYASGWRCCETCGKQVHCGCIVSIHAFVLLDAGGIKCTICTGRNLSMTPKQKCPHRPFRGLQMQLPARNRNQTPEFASNGLCRVEHLLNKSVDYLTSGSQTSFEVAMPFGFERLCQRNHAATFPQERNQTLNLSFTGSLKHIGSGKHEFGKAVVNMEEGPHSCHMPPLHQSILKDGRCTQLSPFNTGANNNARVCSVLYQQPNLQEVVEKRLCANSHNVDSCCQSQKSKLKPVEFGGQKELQALCKPEISDEELQQPSGSTRNVITPLFEKRLSASDAGRVGRLVLPKKYAETYFPPISQPEGLSLNVQDMNGKEWIFQFRFWLNNNSRMYVLEGINNYVQSLQLQTGDTVSFGRREPEGKLILSFRKTSCGPQSDQGADAVKSGNKIHSRHSSGCVMKKAARDSSTISIKRKSIMSNSKRKRSRVNNMDFFQFKVTLEEVQGLLRSPLNHAPHVVVIEDFEFEEYEDAPIVGRPMIIVRDSQGSSCGAGQQLSVKQLKKLLYVNNPVGTAACNKLQDTDFDAQASEDLEAFDNVSVEEDCEFSPASTQPTTKHPRHKLGCSCIVCNQSPSGGPKHIQNCSCKVCMVRRRSHSMMIRHEKTQFERSVIQECKPQGESQSPKKSDPEVELLQNNCKECVNSDEDLIVSVESRLDLNTQPK